MDSTARETLEFLEENDIKFIRLAFCDIFGVQKNIAVMASQLGHALEHGVACLLYTSIRTSGKG